MCGSQNVWILVLLLILIKSQQSWSQSLAVTKHQSFETASATTDLNKLMLISDDVIQDKIENDIKKVIRVNPLDLPLIKQDTNFANMDSSLYKIQNLNKRQYINIQRAKPLKENIFNSEDYSTLSAPEKILKPKHQPKRKKLHFIYNQANLDGDIIAKSLPVHVAPGAYPVYYFVAKTNGRFGKYPLKNFDSPETFLKYMLKNKLENLPLVEAFKEQI